MDPWAPEDAVVRSRYQVELLADAELTAEGVAYVCQGDRVLLLWSEIEAALAADIGEPEGVRTIVFDLLIAREEGACRVARFDREPGEDAMVAARHIGNALPPEASTPSIKSVATDGIATRWVWLGWDARQTTRARCSTGLLSKLLERTWWSPYGARMTWPPSCVWEKNARGTSTPRQTWPCWRR